MDSQFDNEIRELLIKAESALQYGDKRGAGVLVNQILQMDYTNLSAWLLIQKLVGNNQSLKTFQIEFTKRYYPDRLNLLEKPSHLTQTAQPAVGIHILRQAPSPAQNIDQLPPQLNRAKKRSTGVIFLLLILTLLIICVLLTNIALLIIPEFQNLLVSFGYSRDITIISLAGVGIALFFLIGMWARQKWATFGFIGTIIFFPILVYGIINISISLPFGGVTKPALKDAIIGKWCTSGDYQTCFTFSKGGLLDYAFEGAPGAWPEHWQGNYQVIDDNTIRVDNFMLIGAAHYVCSDVNVNKDELLFCGMTYYKVSQ